MKSKTLLTAFPIKPLEWQRSKNKRRRALVVWGLYKNLQDKENLHFNQK